MPAEESQPIANAGEPSPDKPRYAARRSAIRFSALFSLTVLGLLVGYRYGIDTVLNDWYLFQVARHTTFVLDAVGHRAELEKSTGEHLQPAEVRSFLYGERPPSDTPLSPWETWRYRAEQRRLQPTPRSPIGPHVTFVFQPGIQHRVEALETRLDELRGTFPMGHQINSAEATELKTTIQELRAQQTAGIADPAIRQAHRGKAYNFIVIPECGAVEVIAIFLAAVIAFPARWSARIAGLVAGIPVLYVVNILRLSFLAWVGAVDHSGAWFDFFHAYVWQAVYVIFVVIVWMAWVALCVRKNPA